MTEPRFLQIHSLHSYSAVLLNRDDTGLAKRLPYGGKMRTRISSQCLKRHWRANDSVFNLHNIAGAEEAYRSREVLTNLVFADLEAPAEVIGIIKTQFQKSVYGDKGADLKGRQPLLIGAPEVRWLKAEAKKLVAEANGSAKAADDLVKEWAKTYKAVAKQMRDTSQLPGGLTSALFGRMVTSDPEANIDAPVHVAHAFTVHEQEDESDYFSVVDDLKRDDEDAGAAHIGETELTSGLFYGYVVVDVPGLVSNLTGCERKDWQKADREIAGKVVQHLVHLIAEVSPGAKLGSTAPYGYAEMMLIEAGDRQPRSLSGAFRAPCDPNLDAATAAFKAKLAALDEAYATGEARRHLHIAGAGLPGSQKLPLTGLAEWAGAVVARGEAQ
ncbi:type I-E CRISPR-associated protein Cas7/Cse4/CasC [Rhodomicrobium vannielii ATCC 17100]|uniref:type I-E CRISPR-associated protein Cas7/Cse4/CasC n=1 Tax=Rhodomicrobium vannielii TaxID=1069 RepID=UPI0019186944|nr:type I-E CRISPR-associated protein Cas7/Cse4/CasC [Rhodomicrobium vannielii]MBJ7533587.1 type I-E CRISPR-associated protein Cas7/Cse4/CasC [Rhodomicrobium vannielii ATCC 17100]